MPKRHLLIAWSEAHQTIFIKLCTSLQEAIKTTINHDLVAKVAWIEYRHHRYTMPEIYKLGHQAVYPRNRLKHYRQYMPILWACGAILGDLVLKTGVSYV